MGSGPWPLIVVVVLLVSLAPVNGAQAEEGTANGATLDVDVLTETCMENET